VAHRPRRPAVVALALLAATACGHHGSAKTPMASATSGGPSATASRTAGQSGQATGSSPGTSGAPAASSGAAAPSGGSSRAPSASDPASPGTAVTVKVRNLCVQPGGTQTADVRTAPGADVHVDTIYADNKEGTTHGGLGNGTADASGRYAFTWTVRLGTPEGKANTLARATKYGVSGTAFARFLVSLHCTP
jgi:hypothetical protein